MVHLRLALRLPFAVIGGIACFVATHHWACRGMPRHGFRSEEE